MKSQCRLHEYVTFPDKDALKTSQASENNLAFIFVENCITRISLELQ